MAAVTRQPFTPLDGPRLQTLTSLKNSQNAISNTSSSPAKRKASDIVDVDDSENLDPVLFSKRSKASDSSFPANDFFKPANQILIKSVSTGSVAARSLQASLTTPRPRNLLQPKSPAARLNAGIAKSSPLSAPAGRSPTRGKRTGLLSSRRRTAGPYSRVDPPVFGLGSVGSAPAPFSLDAALKGTIPSYTSRNARSTASTSRASSLGDLLGPDSKSSWFFDIHEDTAEQEMTNLLQHSTCVLDISSDEESETRLERELAEGKENVPPVDDISQISRAVAQRAVADLDEMVFEKERCPLGEMNVTEYYAHGCDETSVIIIPADEDEEEAKTEHETASNVAQSQPASDPAPDPASVPLPDDGCKSVEELMQKAEEPAPSAALLEPIEGTGEQFEVWESGSTKDETETAVVC